MSNLLSTNVVYSEYRMYLCIGINTERIAPQSGFHLATKIQGGSYIIQVSCYKRKVSFLIPGEIVQVLCKHSCVSHTTYLSGSSASPCHGGPLVACVNCHVLLLSHLRCTLPFMWGSLRLAPIIIMHVCVKLVHMCTQVYYSYSIFVQVPVQWVHICVVHVHLSV